ncbi:hypothetical protein T484DRAFT_1972987 [Baffinella frigidus]|nr:hypothetical protein T484DRAFT_1972987 [Cryptophyta sp. CCMP2293]|mmetsp:Transcript_25127/g.59613  ORF Transcript_25127/g.59613 Transcript_25127/m.59613 type:complete len:137 (+) Transcript_25127:34-444(+)
MGRAPSGAEGEPGVELSDPSTWSIGWAAVLVPNAVMLLNHHRGGSTMIFTTIIKRFGVHGLFVFPFVALGMEKSFYDSAMSLRGIDPNQRAADREGEGFPSGGHLLPSFSVVAVRDHAITLRDILPSALFPAPTEQ